MMKVMIVLVVGMNLIMNKIRKKGKLLLHRKHKSEDAKAPAVGLLRKAKEKEFNDRFKTR